MNRIATTLIWAFSLFFVSKTEAQTKILMRTGTVNTGTCGASFFDTGDAAGGYGNNQSFTLTIYSDDPTNNHIALGFNDIDLAPGDELCFFDGPNVSSPSLGCASDFTNNSNLVVETTSRDSLGCMTIRFTSNGSGNRARLVCQCPLYPVLSDIHDKNHVCDTCDYACRYGLG